MQEVKEKEQYTHTLKVEFQKKISESVTKHRKEIKIMKKGLK